MTAGALVPLAHMVAREVAAWSGADADDLLSAMLADVSAKTGDYLTLLATEGGEDMVVHRLRRVARDGARREHVRILRETGQYFYEPEYVRLFLPFFFARQDWAGGPAPDPAAGTWRTGEAIDTAIDMAEAWARLKTWQANIIVTRHMVCPPVAGRVPWDAIADATGRASGQAAEAAYYRATRALTIEMNANRARRAREHEGPAPRKRVGRRGQ